MKIHDSFPWNINYLAHVEITREKDNIYDFAETLYEYSGHQYKMIYQISALKTIFRAFYRLLSGHFHMDGVQYPII